MGNAGSSSMNRERQKATELLATQLRDPPRDSVSSGAGVGQAFTFEKQQDTRTVLHGGSSQEDEEPYYTKPIGSTAAGVPPPLNFEHDVSVPSRKISSTISVGTSIASTMEASESIDVGNKDSNFEEEQLLRNPALPTVLRWDGGGKNVMISGTFSKWKPMPMVRSHGNFVTIIDLPEGDHQYKFYVDGEWKYDPKLKSVENNDGIKNNLVSVRQSDFEVFQALAKDSENTPNYAEREYSQEVPQAKPWEKISGPPVLPPHLLQVILNKDTPLSCEPTLLPEPNHVMLNHLYALSIKDGVMVLSATHRYRKKYVTTLLYKPI